MAHLLLVFSEGGNRAYSIPVSSREEKKRREALTDGLL